MERRQFLGMTTFGLAALGAPSWLVRAYGQDGGKARTDDLQTALKRARERGKPLLVFVVPAGTVEQHERGRVIGALLANGGDALYADLALCEVACIRAEELEVIARPDSKKTGLKKALALLFDTTTWNEGPKTIAADVKPVPEIERGTSRAEAKKIHERWAAPLAETIQKAILPSVDALAARVQQAAEALGAEKAKDAREWMVARVEPSVAEIDAAAAIARAHVDRYPAAKELWTSRLARAARTRIWEAPPQGAKWATSTGCGTRIEGEEPKGRQIACGRAHIPAGSRRFLVFYTDE